MFSKPIEHLKLQRLYIVKLNKYEYIYIYLLVFSLFFCSSKRTNQTNEENNPREIIEGFYKWYIHEAYPKVYDYYQIPPYKKVGETKYIFNKTELRARLSKVKFLSNEYINFTLDKLEACNAEMLKIDWDAVPESQFNIRQCDYLWFDNWLGGQGENIDGFRIVSEVNTKDGIEFTVEILINKEIFTHSKVTVKKEEEKYKINKIELVWK